MSKGIIKNSAEAKSRTSKTVSFGPDQTREFWRDAPPNSKVLIESAEDINFSQIQRPVLRRTNSVDFNVLPSIDDLLKGNLPPHPLLSQFDAKVLGKRKAIEGSSPTPNNAHITPEILHNIDDLPSNPPTLTRQNAVESIALSRAEAAALAVRGPAVNSGISSPSDTPRSPRTPGNRGRL